MIAAIKYRLHQCFRVSQLELKSQLDILSEELKKISADQTCPIDLEVYSNKLINSRHKISVVNNILQAAQVILWL